MNSALHTLPLAASSGNSGSFLVQPSSGLTVWTIVVFLISMAILAKWVFPRIRDGLDRRAQAIEASIDQAEEMRQESEKILEDYRKRLQEARQQAEEIITRARKAAEAQDKEAKEAARAERERLLEQTRRDVEAETRRAIDEIRREVADLTVLATEKVTRKTLTDEDHRRLVEDALSELDFSALAGGAE